MKLSTNLQAVAVKIILSFVFTLCSIYAPPNTRIRRGGAEVAGWTLDRNIRVRFPAYPHRVWALWWQGGKRRLRTSRCPCRGRLGTLKTPSCPWRGCPTAGQHLETGHLSRHYSWNIAECDVKPQSTTTTSNTRIDIEDFEHLLVQIKGPIMILGYFNSHNPLWGSDHKTSKGKVMETFISQNDLCLYNDGSYTFLRSGNGSYSAIDLSFASASLFGRFFLGGTWRLLWKWSLSNHSDCCRRRC